VGTKRTLGDSTRSGKKHTRASRSENKGGESPGGKYKTDAARSDGISKPKVLGQDNKGGGENLQKKKKKKTIDGVAKIRTRHSSPHQQRRGIKGGGGTPVSGGKNDQS